MENKQTDYAINFCNEDIILQNYGTDAEPLFKVMDIIVKLLGYRDSATAAWFKSMRNNEKYVITKNKVYHFTLEGLKFAEVK